MKPSARMHRSLRIGGGGTSRPYDGKIAGLYDLEETLGRGHFAVVKLARHVFTGEKVAVKVIDKSKLDEVSKAHLFQEVRCMKLVQHPNVVRLYEVIDTATKLYLILELGDGGDLYEYIIRHDTGLPEQVAKEYFSQIVRAISYCHQLHVVHRDLKPENVVFFKKLGIVKLTDFGFSNKFYPGQKLETSCGSLAYSAPEILLGDSYDAPAVDVWSLGVILYMLVCGQPPFQEANDSETLTMIMDCKYNVPPHVSTECRDLIARMLVRNPEKRATLNEIARHPWLARKETLSTTDNLPLISKEQLSEEDHNLIVQKIVNGKIATKEEIQECLDKNEYNHITATYYLLAERKLRSKRQEQATKNKRPEHLPVPNSSPAPKQRDNNGTGPNQCLLAVPRTPGDVPQRTRKCSIVQEDEEEEDISSCSGREELGPPLNRRGSRSEGRLNLALQERLAESERRKLIPENNEKLDNKLAMIKSTKITDKIPQNNKWQMGKSASLTDSPVQTKLIEELAEKTDITATTTTIITDCSTISIPIISTTPPVTNNTVPKYKTMPSPTRTTTSPIQLNEIFEEGDIIGGDTTRPTSRQFVRNQNRTPYEQRRSKFHKTRTASCSSSDASDDDSEKRKKRAHKLNTSAKPFQGRRDSHDDSSDSQEPGTGAGTGSTNRTNVTQQNSTTQNNSQDNKTTNNNSTNNSNTGRKNTTNTNVMLGRRHKASRRRNGETRLRESQSLNRITEVQEDGAHALVISTTVVGTQGAFTPKVRGIGARILQGLNMNNRRSSEIRKTDDKTAAAAAHISRKDTVKSLDMDDIDRSDIENCNKIVAERNKKMRLFGKYFHVHKKLCIPLPNMFNRNRLYKAQSCSSLSRDKLNLNTEAILKCRQRAVSVIRNSVSGGGGGGGIGDDGDINQNKNDKVRRKSSTVLQLNNVCNDLTGICAVHLGQASKCCSFC